MSEKMSVREFFARFPDDDTCLDHIMKVRYGLRHKCASCGVNATFHRLKQRSRCYSCSNCGHHVYPTADTIFKDTRTPLQLWFYAIFLFVTTRHGVSGKELERTLGVTYKTAWRMGHKIRELMASADEFALIQGHIEADEAYIGGKRPGKRGRGAAGKTIVFGLKERDGRMVAVTIPNVKKNTLREVVKRQVAEGSIVSTDELMSYGLLTGDGYKHGTVKHGAKEFAYYDYRHGATHHTNHVESFWRLFKKSVASTHIHISPKYADLYLKEFTFRSNHRHMRNAMFDLLIAAI